MSDKNAKGPCDKDGQLSLVQLLGTQAQLHQQLEHLQVHEELSAGTINTISLIVKTLEKINQMVKAILDEQGRSADQMSQDEYEVLKGKVGDLIKRAVQQKTESTA